MSENKTGKYFKYAIGEIILVVIGILIALQINNWNENRIAQNSKTQYCEQLLEELELDITVINAHIERLDGDINSYKTYAAIYNTPNLTLDIVRSNIKKVPSSYGSATFNTKTIEVLKSTGDIKLLSNEIQTLLITLENKQKAYNDAMDVNYGLYTNSLQDTYLINSLSIERKLANQKLFTQALNFKNKLPDQLAMQHLAYTAKAFADRTASEILNNILKSIKELKPLIEEEIK